jgi:PEP-CTERM motif
MNSPRLIFSNACPLASVLVDSTHRGVKHWVFLLLAWTMFFTHSVKGAAYVFTNIADSHSGFSPFSILNPPSINAFAQAAFFGQGFGFDAFGIYRGSGGPLTTIASNVTGFRDLDRQPSINNEGAVGFGGFPTPAGSGLFIGDGSLLTTIALNSGNPYTMFQSISSINEGGAIAFSAVLDSGDAGIFVIDGGSTRTIVLRSEPIFSGFFSDLALNAAGTVAFHGYLDAGGNGIFTGNGGPTVTVATDSGPFSGFDQFPGINSAGTVVFEADLDAGGSGVFSGDGGPLLTLALSEGTPYASFFGTSINTSGAVAFRANLDAGGSGIFTGPDAATDKIIARNDALFGSTIKNVSLGNSALNDAGQVAFFYELNNGRTGIAVATPVVPEPSALGLLCMFGAASLALRWRRH